ncbi:DUF4381 domain-containing protein [Shimia sp. R10_1]|uniref:DUF4381 domain-containing protein n=1 Tax=Shimia sp. R10_1 TaxID=2821095 RepID=UPI001ADB48F8|nr:DUF4381 domain-containing protein [Shimia sp. R10_1]MBO9474676.1 DUF4381 domain-containing protein [Shimia sp. R10_1]
MSETAAETPTETSEAQADSLVGLINQLAEVPEPEAVSMMPQTVGWAVLAGMLLLVLMAWVWRIWKRYQANAYRREALVALEQVSEDAAAISALLKRTALTAYGRSRVAALSGERWLAFLDATIGTSEPAFSNGAGHVLAQAAYRPEPVPAGPDLQDLARWWIKHHPSASDLEGRDV